MKRLLMLLLCITACFCFAACGKNETTENGSTQSSGTNADMVDDAESYVFAYNGVEFSVNQDMAKVLPLLGEPVNYYEAASCAFEGLDKIYTYASFQIDTFPSGGTDIIASIYFRDDLVKTQEGVSLYMNKADMIKAYGQPMENNGTAHIYQKGNGTLRFILNDSEEIISIEYQTVVTYK
ncbi:MAG: hypothetical protein IJB96_04250 [Lachnospira sp.]|nr:hypothetical protein [Lachnospira sp.]